MTELMKRSPIIKNLAPVLTERGKIKIGEKGKMIKSRGGAEFQLPTKLEYFKVVSLHRGEDGNYIRDAAVHDIYKEKPTELPVRLLFDDIELNFQCRYSCFKGKTQWCSGDGEHGWRPDENGEMKLFKCPCHRQDPAYKGNEKCKINSVLSVLIDGVETIGGVWKFRTTSYNSTVGLLSSLTLIKSVTGGPLAGIPLTLSIAPKTVVSPSDGKIQTVYIVGLEYKGSFEKLQHIGYTRALDRQKHMIRMEDLEDNARKLLQSGNDIVDEDVVEEFYPEQMVEEAVTEQVQKAKDLTAEIKNGVKVEAKADYTPQEVPEPDPEGIIPNGSEPVSEPEDSLFDQIKKARPSLSERSMAAYVSLHEDNTDAIRSLPKPDYEYTMKKWKRACPGELFPARPKTEDEQQEEEIPPPIEETGTSTYTPPPATEVKNGGYDVHERMDFLEQMAEFKKLEEGIESLPYTTYLNDNGCKKSGDVKPESHKEVLDNLTSIFKAL